MSRYIAIPDLQTLLLIEGRGSFVLAGIIGKRFPLCLETLAGEICSTLDRGDIVAVSAPEGGPLEPALMLLELVRSYHHPLVVLPSGHPGSKRLRFIVSAASEISLSCAIQRGTHPEQHLLCSSDELAGVLLRKRERGIEIHHLPPEIHARLIRPTLAMNTPDRDCDNII
jgi:hypothetical protein